MDSRSPAMSRPIWAEVNVANFRHNVRQLLRVGQHRTSLLAVLKANAYGHGAVPLAHILCEQEFEDRDNGRGVKMLGVASVGEGFQLREAAIELPILLLSAILPDEAEAVVEAGLTPTVFTPEVASALNAQGDRTGRQVPAHLKIDTGMNRIGVTADEAPEFLRFLREFPQLDIEGIYTHFACADAEDDAMTMGQTKYFEAALHKCGIAAKDSEYTIHAANTAAFMRRQETHFDMARCGLALYGLWPSPHTRRSDVDLQPVMSLRARITHVHRVPIGQSVSYGARWVAQRDSLIATVPCGYADGYPRTMTGRAEVLLRGRRAPVCGTITMDQILVDVTDFKPNAEVGEVVTLWGRDGEESITVNEVADWAGTIPYEITCGVAPRVPRIIAFAENWGRSTLG
jgi:alanine racemase